MKVREIRSEIDKIDSEIRALLSKRSSLVTEAVRCGYDPRAPEQIFRETSASVTGSKVKKYKGMMIGYQDV